MPGPNRRGVSGWAGPKSYSSDRGPKTRSGVSDMDGTIPAMERVYSTPLLDRLGIRPGMRVATIGSLEDAAEIGAGDPSFRDRVLERTTDLAEGRPKPESDVVLLAADTTAELAALSELRTWIRPNGSIWVVSPKGKAATVRDVDVISAARENGLVDNKVVSFSATRTALRLVIPVALRPGA
jgi:hypothetical protein